MLAFLAAQTEGGLSGFQYTFYFEMLSELKRKALTPAGNRGNRWTPQEAEEDPVPPAESKCL
ncbi:hypothetical protein D9X91_02975 [Falsibacillus albus]|uniref:Uncharacterized protein n=1 Tax=Falsibacillus albus TaxID=2478915 RepID=A0A3L7K2A0_9BACI|nr:hypothetical protein D9X91_02975 [Falsibacillus albus]